MGGILEYSFGLIWGNEFKRSNVMIIDRISSVNLEVIINLYILWEGQQTLKCIINRYWIPLMDQYENNSSKFIEFPLGRLSNRHIYQCVVNFH